MTSQCASDPLSNKLSQQGSLFMSKVEWKPAVQEAMMEMKLRKTADQSQ
jgi:hypothetical protein